MLRLQFGWQSRRWLSTQKLMKYDLYDPETAGHNPSKNPSIFFLHGLLSNKKHNKKASLEISKRLNATVIAPDFRNHGESFHTFDILTFDSMVEDLHYLYRHLVQSHQIAQKPAPVIMGHSLGGKVAMLFALRYPELAKGVISIDNIPYENPPESVPEFHRFRQGLSFMRDEIVGNEFLRTLEEVDLQLSRVEADPSFRLFLMSNLKRVKGPEGYLFQSRIPLQPIIDSLDEIMPFRFVSSVGLDHRKIYKGPLLIIQALHSTFTALEKEENRSKIPAHFPNYEIIKIDASHWLVSEKTEQFVEIVTSWYKEHFS